MENDRFDALAQQFANIGSRRKVLRTLAGGALAAVLARTGVAGVAAEEAATACLRDGTGCRRGNQCCSGVCRRGKCRPAPLQGTCTIRKDTCAVTGGIGFGPKCNGVEGCECIKTKSGAAFCREIGGAFCKSCNNDLDCEFEFGPGAKCIAGRPCGFPCTREVGDFCAVPCGFDPESRKLGGAASAAVPAAS